MKIALVHDWLDNRVGGAEEVFLELASLYPKADVFTLLYNKKNYDKYLAGRHIRVSFLRHLPKFMRNRPALMLPFIRRAVRSYDFAGYDLVISDSSAWSKNIVVPKGVKHICYCHSPARMLWDSWPKYLDNFALAKNAVVRFVIIWYISRLRLWDYYTTESVDELIANSHYVAGRIKKFYGREAVVVCPPVASPPAIDPADSTKSDQYWLMLSTLASYKNIDKIIAIFVQTGRRLVVAGGGAEAGKLAELAKNHPNIELVGRVDEKTKWSLLAGAEALILANVEDFGITPVEANAVGTPVLAVRGGGVDESMVAGKTAIFFDELDLASLETAIKQAQKTAWHKKTLLANANRFGVAQFQAGIKKVVKSNVK